VNGWAIPRLGSWNGGLFYSTNLFRALAFSSKKFFGPAARGKAKEMVDEPVESMIK
jgi:hypothetical protein